MSKSFDNIFGYTKLQSIWRFHLPVGGKQLFTHFHPDAGIISRNNSVSDWDSDLSGNLLDHPGQKMLLGRTMFSPRGEPSQLSVVAIICHKHLWSDQENLSILDDDPAVVLDILVHNGPKIQ